MCKMSVRGKPNKQIKKKKNTLSKLKRSIPPPQDNPLSNAIRAQLFPFEVSKGAAKRPEDPRNSQAATARASGTITIPTGQTLFFMWQPNACSNSGASSFAYNVVTSSSAATTAWSSSATATGTRGGLATTTPYSISTMNSEGMEFRLVGAGLRLRNATNQLNTEGILRYVLDPIGVHRNGFSANNTSDVNKTLIDSSQAQVRKLFNTKDTVVEIFYPTNNVKWQDVTTAESQYAYVDDGTGNYMTGLQGGASDAATSSPTYTTVNGTVLSGTTLLGAAPGVFGYYQNTSTGSQVVDIEVIEHWEYHARGLTSLHTDSVSHQLTQHAINSVISHVSTNHSNDSTKTQKMILKDAVKLATNKHVLADAKLVAPLILAA